MPAKQLSDADTRYELVEDVDALGAVLREADAAGWQVLEVLHVSNGLLVVLGR